MRKEKTKTGAEVFWDTILTFINLVFKIYSFKVTAIRKMCKELGLKAEGSSFDMILRMRDVSLNRSSFDWAYEKVFGKTGIVYFCIFFN